jgi:hypothetical protein
VTDLHARLLERAAEILGGPDEVAAYLGVSRSHVRIWMRGMFSPPDEVFLKLVDLVSEARMPDAQTRLPHGGKRGGPAPSR